MHIRQSVRAIQIRKRREKVKVRRETQAPPPSPSPRVEEIKPEELVFSETEI